jgi:phosphate/sulfate permease
MWFILGLAIVWLLGPVPGFMVAMPIVFFGYIFWSAREYSLQAEYEAQIDDGEEEDE